MGTQVTREKANPVPPLLAGRYRIERVIGRGGMGEVLRAYDEHMERPVAIKRIKPLRERTVEQTQALHLRFKQEQHILANLKSRNIVPIFDHGIDQSGAPFFVMELLEGRDLGQVVQEDGTLEPKNVRWMCLEILEVIEEAHTRSVLHRDLKPANIFLQSIVSKPLGQVRVLDFGIAKTMGVEMTAHTQNGEIWYTTGFTAPEIFEGDACEKSDIYALGAVAFFALKGEPPSFHEDIEAKLRNESPDVPSSLSTCLSQMLRYQPRLRPSASELRQQLETLPIPTDTRFDVVLGREAKKPPWRSPPRLRTLGFFFLAGGCLGLLTAFWLFLGPSTLEVFSTHNPHPVVHFWDAPPQNPPLKLAPPPSKQTHPPKKPQKIEPPPRWRLVHSGWQSSDPILTQHIQNKLKRWLKQCASQIRKPRRSAWTRFRILVYDHEVNELSFLTPGPEPKPHWVLDLKTCLKQKVSEQPTVVATPRSQPSSVEVKLRFQQK